MAILVSRAFLDEEANGVAFTGNPSCAQDGRYLVNAQLGETSVVSPPAGVFAERSFVELGEGGEVVAITRSAPSSLVGEGGEVLDDDALRELGAALAIMDERFAVDLDGHPAESVLLDVEFKLEASEGESRIAIKAPARVAAISVG